MRCGLVASGPCNGHGRYFPCDTREDPDHRRPARAAMTWLSRLPLHPVLFAAYAVLLLYAANLGAGAAGRRRRAAGPRDRWAPRW